MIQRNLLVDFFAVVFGIGAWVSINGLWVELPLLVKDLPEEWNLPSYMSIVIQFANIGPISYSILRLLRPSVQPTPIIYAIVTIGCLASLFLPLFWDHTSVVGGFERSTALLILIFFLGFVDCTSSVLYIPYMAVWKEIYLPSYLIGEGLSGLLPALVALGQGVGGNVECENVTIYDDSAGEAVVRLRQKELQPNFSVDTFFYILFTMMLASCLAFVSLELLPLIQGERSESDCSSRSSSIKLGIVNDNKTSTNSMRRNTFFFLLVVQTWSSMLANGLLPSIQSFSCGPYGDVPYHLAATLSALVNPLAAFCTMILPRAPPKMVGLLSVLGTGFGGYIFTTAVMSPAPPLKDHVIGSVLIVLAWVSFSGIISYVRVEIANLMREDGAQPLFWSGAVTQAGSAIGAIFAFLFVNVANIFQYYNPCA